jgi:hypothetical protein
MILPGREKPAIRSDRPKPVKPAGRAVRLPGPSGGFPQVSRPYSQAHHGQKKICPAQKAGIAVCKHPLSPNHHPGLSLFMLIDCATTSALWIRHGVMARLRHRESRQRRLGQRIDLTLQWVGLSQEQQ